MKVSSRGYGDAVRGLSHGKGAKVSLGRGTPTKREGSDGDLTLRSTNRGVILYAKYGGRWYSIHTSQPLIPGMIIMWSGKRHSIPKGWVICDGNGGTPDLRAKFIIGAGKGDDFGAFDTGAPSYQGLVFGPDASYSTSSVATTAKAGFDGAAANTAAVTGATGNTAADLANHTHKFPGDDQLGTAAIIAATGHSVETASAFSYDAVSSLAGAGGVYNTDDTGAGGGHTHDQGTLHVTPGTTDYPLVDFYSLAFIMYVGSAAEPGTEGFNQTGEGGGELGRGG